MRLLPFPWEGLHPAFPNKAEPFNNSAVANAAVYGGTLGCLVAVGAAMVRRSPQAGLKAAAYATPVLAVSYHGLSDYAGRKITTPYLESKGIHVPRRKLVDRPFDVDADNFVLAGALSALALARLRSVQWSVTGWKRAVGLMSIGAFAGDITNYAYNWRQITPAAEQVKQNKAARLLWAADIAEFVRQREESEQEQPAMTPLQELMKHVQDGSLLDRMESQVTGEQLDEQDPQPHTSEVRDGERIFKPETNYRWEAGPDAIPKLEAHIDTLRARRSKLADEAAMLFHDIAVKEAAYYDTPPASPQKDKRRIVLEVLNHLHINAYLDISQLDWCIADSQKNMLQMRAMADATHWVPDAPAPPPARPKHALALLAELEHDNQMVLAEQEMLRESGRAAMRDPHLEAADPATGRPIRDPYGEIRKELAELEKAQRESKLMQEAINDLRDRFSALDDGEDGRAKGDGDK